MKNTGNIALIISIVAIIIVGYNQFISPSKKIGIVQMEELVYNYQGMKDATEKYNIKMTAWSEKIDSLENSLKGLYNEIKLDSINGDKNKLIKDQQQFYFLQKSYYEYKQNITQKAQQNDEEMTTGVINQLKEHMKTFAQEEGFDLIISNTQLQNVGYVEAEMDITQQLLQYANNKYEGE